MNDRGSIFVETLVAAAFLAAVLGSTLSVVGDSRVRDRAVAERRLALLVARSQLAAAGADLPLSPGVTDGLDGDLTWRVRVDPCPEAEAASRAGALYCLHAEVRADAAGPVLARLATRRLGPAL